MPTAEARILIPPDISSARSGAFRRDWETAGFGGATMGTTWSVKASLPPSIDPSHIEAGITEVLDTVIQQMSPWESDSDLQRFQKAPEGQWVTFRPEAFRVLQRAVEIAAQTESCYDPTYAQAINLLGFGPSPYFGNSYSSPEVLEALAESGYKRLVLDPPTRRVRQPGSLGIDLCSIAKGYAVDLVAESLKSQGIDNFFVEIGGEARGLGCKPNGEPWLIALDRPAGLSESLKLATTQVALCGISIATSGNYLRYHLVDGQPIGHLVSHSQDDQLNQLKSVSILSSCCMDADAYATALYLMGTEEGLAFAAQHDLAAIFLTSSGEEISPAALSMLS